MLRMRTLGVLELDGGGTRASKEIARQPKRFALLAHLATRRPAPVAGRDHLLAMFWPELDRDRARNALNKSLHYLRARLPDGALPSHGRSEVGIEHGAIQVDAVDFVRLLDGGRTSAALELYRGPFLPSLHVSDAPGFQEWVDGERGWYKDQARRAGLELVDAALDMGRTDEALRWSDALQAVDPNDEGVVRAGVRAHLRAGDRTSALRTLERYEGWLREEMGMGVPAALVRLLGDGAPRDPESTPDPGGTDEPAPDLLAQSREAIKVETLEEHRAFIDDLPDIAFRIDLRGSFPFVNQRMIDVTGYDRDELRDVSYEALVREDFRDRVIEFYVRQIDERIPMTYLEFPAVLKDGRELWVGQRSKLLVRDGTPVGCEVITRDITTRVRREKANRRGDLEDRETRLLNRKAFHLLAAQCIREKRRAEGSFFVQHLRLTHPSDDGDASAAVRIVAGVLERTVRECDVIARLDEAEVVVLSIQGDHEAAETMRARIVDVLSGLEDGLLAGWTWTCQAVVHDAAQLRSADAVMTFTWTEA